MEFILFVSLWWTLFAIIQLLSGNVLGFLAMMCGVWYFCKIGQKK
jgi:hypothetical protein